MLLAYRRTYCIVLFSILKTHLHSHLTQILIQMGLPSFITVIYNAQLTCNNRLKSSETV